jgi:hypothetical protein
MGRTPQARKPWQEYDVQALQPMRSLLPDGLVAAVFRLPWLRTVM